MTRLARSSSGLAGLGLLLTLAACSARAPSPAAAPAPAAPDAAPSAPADPADAAAPPEDAAAPAPAPDLPLAQDPPPTVWTPALIPAPVLDDTRARIFLISLAADGLTARYDPLVGVVWADGLAPPVTVKGDDLAPFGPALAAAVPRDLKGVPCRAAVCTFASGAERWFVFVRRTGYSSGERVVAGVLRSATGWPMAATYDAWIKATRASWQTRDMELLGEGLSFEEAGRYLDALASFTRLAELDPENPWALYYASRDLAMLKRPRDAYVLYRRLGEHSAAAAVVAQLRVGRDPEMVRFRTHSAVIAVQTELTLPPPDGLEAFAAWLYRFRAATERLAEVAVLPAVTPEALGALLEARLLDPPTLDAAAPALVWEGARLDLRKNALGGLEVVGLSETPPPAAP